MGIHAERPEDDGVIKVIHVKTMIHFIQTRISVECLGLLERTIR